MLLSCTCQSPFQDKEYGRLLRVHNECKKEPNTYRCTVCNNVKKKSV